MKIFFGFISRIISLKLALTRYNIGFRFLVFIKKNGGLSRIISRNKWWLIADENVKIL